MIPGCDILPENISPEVNVSTARAKQKDGKISQPALMYLLPETKAIFHTFTLSITFISLYHTNKDIFVGIELTDVKGILAVAI